MNTPQILESDGAGTQFSFSTPQGLPSAAFAAAWRSLAPVSDLQNVRWSSAEASGKVKSIDELAHIEHEYASFTTDSNTLKFTQPIHLVRAKNREVLVPICEQQGDRFSFSRTSEIRNPIQVELRDGVLRIAFLWCGLHDVHGTPESQIWAEAVKNLSDNEFALR